MNALTTYSAIVVLASIIYIIMIFNNDIGQFYEPDFMYYTYHNFSHVFTGLLALALFFVSNAESNEKGEEGFPGHSDKNNIGQSGGEGGGKKTFIVLRILVILGCIIVGFGYMSLYIPLQGGSVFYFFFSWVIWYILACIGSCCLGSCCS